MDQKEEFLSIVEDTKTLLSNWKEPIYDMNEKQNPPPKQSKKTKTQEPQPKPISSKKKPPEPIDLKLEPLDLKPKKTFPHFKNLLQDMGLTHIENPLADNAAKSIKNKWKRDQLIPEIPILNVGSTYGSFLENLAKAIDNTFGSSHVIGIHKFEKENKWDVFFATSHLKLILIPDQIFWNAKNLTKYYKKHPSKKVAYLGKIPLLLLPDLSLYYKDPYLKRSLWNIICKYLSN